MGRIILNIRVAVIAPKESRPGLGEDWAGPMKKSAQKAYKKLRETLPDIDAVIEKVIKPGIKTQRRMFKEDPAYPVRYTRADLEEMARNYLKGVRRGFKPERFDDAIEFGKKYMADETTRLVIPFKGSRKDKIRGLGPFVARLLSGAKNVAGEFISADVLLEGSPVDIIRPDKKGEFRSEFANRIAQAGPRIIRNLANQRTRDNESVLTCQMMNKYKRPDIEPFAPNGKSYMRFVVIDNQLYLEIQVTLK